MKSLILLIASSLNYELPVPKDIDNFKCLVDNIYHEAEGESITGKALVAQVTMNRVNNKFRGKSTYCGVVKDKVQFSWVAQKKAIKIDNEVDYQQLFDSVHVAQMIINGNIVDNTNGAMHFYAPKYFKGKKLPNWIKKAKSTKVVGNHTLLYY